MLSLSKQEVSEGAAASHFDKLSVRLYRRIRPHTLKRKWKTSPSRTT